MRDIEDRGRDLEHVLHQYTTLVKPALEEFCLRVSTSPFRKILILEHIFMHGHVIQFCMSLFPRICM